MIYFTTAIYTPELLQQHKDKVFLFGDNCLRKGKAGQAIIRDEPNAFGIATVWAPNCYFRDDERCKNVIRGDLEEVSDLAKKSDIVVPIVDHGMTSIGRGLARMPEFAPEAWAMMNCQLTQLLPLKHGEAAL